MDKETKNKIRYFMEDMADLLLIDDVEIKYDSSKFMSDTQFGMYHDGVMYLKENTKVNIDTLYAIAHEMRHVWQIKNDYDLYFGDHYKERNKVGLITYNNQLAELDANAFAFLALEDEFGVAPIFPDFSDAYLRRIRKRQSIILKEFDD